MNKQNSIKKCELRALPQIKDRMTFLYVEHCKINRKDYAITIRDIRGVAHIPAAALCVLLLGPGCNISHRAMELIGHSGVSVVWVGEQGVFYYAHGNSLTHSSNFLTKQAELVSNSKSRLLIAKKMYQMRFLNEDVSNLTMQQLRGREGARVRTFYRKMSKETGVKWNGREYTPGTSEGSDLINQALTIAHACLYGVVHSAVVAIGCSAGLGFIHTGHERSFVYDIADLYKAEISIPVAFNAVKDNPSDISTHVRKNMRNKFYELRLIERIIKDINNLFFDSDDTIDELMTDVINLWDDKIGEVDHGVSYGIEYDLSGNRDIVCSEESDESEQ